MTWDLHAGRHRCCFGKLEVSGTKFKFEKVRPPNKQPHAAARISATARL